MMLRTERLLLRGFSQADWVATLAYHSTPAYQRFYPAVRCTEADAQAFINCFIQWQEERPRSKYQWAIVSPGQDRLIGNCGIRKREPDALEAEIGCELAPERWGRGYATELGRMLLRFGFVDLGLQRIYAHCLAENIAAVRLVEKLGLRQDGRLRENVWLQERWSDTLVYSILKQEWEDPGLARVGLVRESSDKAANRVVRSPERGRSRVQGTFRP